MSSPKIVSASRNLLAKHFPIFPTTWASKPAPANIMNSFSRKLIGDGNGVKLVKKLIAADAASARQLFGFEASQRDIQNLQMLIDSTFNADRRAWSTQASLMPITADFISTDPSDEHYGSIPVIWSDLQRGEIALLLRQLLASEGSKDSISKFATALSRMSGSSPTSEGVVLEETQASAFAELSFEVIRKSLSQLILEMGDYGRVAGIKKFEILLTIVASLGLVYDPAAYNCRSTDKEVTPTNVLGLVVYTGTPPGLPSDELVYLASQSFRDFIERAHGGVSIAVRETFDEYLQADDDDVLKLEALLSDHLNAVEDIDMLRPIVSKYRDSSYGLRPTEGVVTFEHLRSAISHLGRKVGFIGPQRSSTSSRLVLETELLEALVLAVGHNLMPFNAFVDQCYQDLGLILGFPSTLAHNDVERLALLVQGDVEIDGCLKRAGKMLEQRMVDAGLAIRHSDGLTMLVIS